MADPPLIGARRALVEAAHRLAASGVVTGTAGNLSARAGPEEPGFAERFIVTASGARLATITADETTLVDGRGQVVDGPRPTSELALHLAIYRAAGERARAIVHAHPLASTAVACTRAELPALHYAVVELGGPVRVAPYARYGTLELADHVAGALAERTAALLQNHGSVAFGDDLDQAVERLELLDWLCELYLRAHVLGGERTLSVAELAAVADEMTTTGYGTVHPTPNRPTPNRSSTDAPPHDRR